MMRLAGKIAVVVGAGQSPGEGIGNGRATVLRFAQEGAKTLAVDRDLASAEETAVLAAKSGGECVAFQADVMHEATLAAAMAAAVARWGRIDILHNNVGVSIAGGDKPLDELTEAAFDRVSAINLRGTIMACKACAAGHAAATFGRDRQHLVGSSLWKHLPAGRLQGDESSDDRFHRAAGVAQRALRHPRQLYPAGG